MTKLEVLDNRRCNLQITTTRVNIRHAHRSGSAYLTKKTGKWRAVVRDEAGKRISLGGHATEALALAVISNWNYRKMLEMEEAGSMEAHHLAEVISNNLSKEA